MTHVLAGIAGPGASVGVAGVQSTGGSGGGGGDTPVSAVAGEHATMPGGEGIGAVGGGADDVLPFTGSVFTLPIALLGAALTVGGWFLTRVSIERR